ncbi:hypothetical protein BJV82DRAFT_662362 [Fennellomyces sp. T-0311]|nr:hypothetical protein BJV82DRAFT_662362 [Fennellomyces sp. T-0311]
MSIDKDSADNLACQDANSCQVAQSQRDLHKDDNGHMFKPAPLRRTYSEMSIECAEPANTYKNSITLPDKIDDEEEEEEEVEFSTTARVQQLFHLPSDERLVAEYPCYLLRLVTLPGWLYVTNRGLCFYASLPGKKGDVQKEGYLYRKAHRTSPLSQRSYFQIKNYVLSWYNSAEDKYLPIDSIDLKQAIDIQDSTTRKFGFRIVSEKRSWSFAADSEVSQKEWMDELRRATFMARNAGSSVRIVLPFPRITNINRIAAFKFAEYIHVKLGDISEAENLDDAYNFAFFPDIETAYQKIKGLWNQETREPGVKRESTLDSQVTDTNPFPSLDNVFSNASGMSALFIGALTNTTSLLSSNGKNKQQRAENSEAIHDQDVEGSSRRSTFSSATDDDQASEKRQQRNSWSFGWLSSQPPPSPVPDSPQLNLPTTHSDSILPQKEIIEVEPKKKGRFRSSSTASIKQLARNTLGLSIAPTPSKEQGPISPQESTNGHLSPTQSSTIKTRHFRSSSFGGTLKKHIRNPPTADDNILTGGTKQAQLQSSWITPDYRDMLEQAAVVHKTSQGANIDISQQKLANEKLHKIFPMLGDAEAVVGVFNSALWKTLPYYGRLFCTTNYICFYSKVLAGKQKLVVPLSDITSVRRLKSRGYYIIHSIGFVAKDMNDEIYLEFSALDIRDSCYALLYILTNGNNTNRSLESFGRPPSIKMSDILATSMEHVMPPIEYSGPPLLSTSLRQESFHQPMPPKNNMHITCLTIGSRGDVQPYIALCKQLQKDGHRCRIASHSEYRSWVEDEHGLEFYSIGGDPGELMKLCIDNGFLSYSFVKDGSKFFYTWFEKLLETAWEACQGTDLLIESPSAMVGIHMAEKLEIPYFRSMPFPWTRTTRFPHPFAMQNYTSGRLLYNDMTYVMIDIALWTGTSKAINRFRRKVLNLPSTTREKLELWRVPHIYSFSSSVLPPPKDWPDYVHCTGYWFLDNPDTKWKPSDELLQFLGNKADTRPIVYIGFGSIIVPDPKAMSSVIVEAVKLANVRAIVCKGWSSRNVNQPQEGDKENKNATDILQGHPHILNLDSVPHDWLFPQIQGVVHHGGAGTTAAGLRAGLPTVIKPFFGDQRFWGQRIEELGVGVCIPKLAVDRLCDALVDITQNSITISKAKSIGETIRQENGTKQAVECIYRDMYLAKRGQ